MQAQIQTSMGTLVWMDCKKVVHKFSFRRGENRNPENVIIDGGNDKCLMFATKTPLLLTVSSLTFFSFCRTHHQVSPTTTISGQGVRSKDQSNWNNTGFILFRWVLQTFIMPNSQRTTKIAYIDLLTRPWITKDWCRECKEISLDG